MGFVARHKVAIVVLVLIAALLLLSWASVMLISPGD
jgi:hypothetical protein